MAGGQQAENTLYENALGWGLLLTIVIICALIFWYYNAPEVRNIIRWIRYGEMWMISWFIMGLEMLGLWDGQYTITHDGKELPWMGYFHSIPGWEKPQLENAIGLINAMAMQPVRLIFVAICALAALWCIFRGPQTDYRTRLGLEGLIGRQAKSFPIITPFVDFNPCNQPPRAPGTPVPVELPLFAEPLGPEEWLAYNQIPIPDGKIDEEMAARKFQGQLIARWKGPNALKPYQQILLAAFCLKASRKREDADHLLGRIALCWSAKSGLKLNKDRKLLSEARKILKNKDLAGGTLKICNQHAFVTTALIRALAFARSEGGVLAPSQFVWLRGHDRTLWYPLNNLGRHSFHMEALGAMSHYKAEKLTMRPIPIPKVEGAVETIISYMSSQNARPIPALDYSLSEKRGIKKAK